jgi:Spy/CpxP family protein refolding chaperone
MKTNLMILVMVVSGMNLFAQGQARGSFGDRRAEKMKTELSLSDEQLARVEVVHRKFRSAYGILLSDTLLTKEEVLVQRTQLLTERDREMKNILTGDQYSKWMTMKPAETHRGYARGSMKDPVDEMKKSLGLTDEQTEKIAGFNKTFAAKVQALRADTTLTRESTANFIRQKGDERIASIKNVLSPMQFEKFMTFEAEHRRRGVSYRRHKENRPG